MARLELLAGISLEMEPIPLARTIHSVTVLSEDSNDWALALAGEGEAFGRIFDRHHQRVLRHSRRFATNPSDADDIAAMTFLEAWRNRAKVKVVGGSVLPWLLVTSTNVASNANRSARRYSAMLASLPIAEVSVAPPFETDEKDALEALRTLSVLDRQVVVLCLLEGYSEREAADALGVPPGTIKSRLSRAKARLRNELRATPSQVALTEEVGQ